MKAKTILANRALLDIHEQFSKYFVSSVLCSESLGINQFAHSGDLYQLLSAEMTPENYDKHFQEIVIATEAHCDSYYRLLRFQAMRTGLKGSLLKKIPNVIKMGELVTEELTISEGRLTLLVFWCDCSYYTKSFNPLKGISQTIKKHPDWQGLIDVIGINIADSYFLARENSKDNPDCSIFNKGNYYAIGGELCKFFKINRIWASSLAILVNPNRQIAEIGHPLCFPLEACIQKEIDIAQAKKGSELAMNPLHEDSLIPLSSTYISEIEQATRVVKEMYKLAHPCTEYTEVKLHYIAINPTPLKNTVESFFPILRQVTANIRCSAAQYPKAEGLISSLAKSLPESFTFAFRHKAT